VLSPPPFFFSVQTESDSRFLEDSKRLHLPIYCPVEPERFMMTGCLFPLVPLSLSFEEELNICMSPFHSFPFLVVPDWDGSIMGTCAVMDACLLSLVALEAFLSFLPVFDAVIGGTFVECNSCWHLEWSINRL